MAKVVFELGQLAHLWAHKAIPYGRKSGQSQADFSGNEFRSYTTVIARHITNKRGQTAVLLSTDTYSHTTSEHQSAVRSAVSHLEVFHVGRVDPLQTPREYLTEYSNRIMALIDRWTRARDRKPDILREIQQTTADKCGF